MKRKSSYSYLVVLLCMIMSLTACAPKVQGGQTDKGEGEAFTGSYIVDAQYVKENIKNENVLLIDARGEESAANGTAEGAIALKWQAIADVESGAPGDVMWGTILEPTKLSERLSSFGISKDKEIILFAGGKTGWGDDGRIAWELIAAGFDNVKMVNGGYDALVLADVPIVRGAASYRPAQVTVDKIDTTHVINTEELVADYKNYKIIDVRADKEYNGEALYGEAKGGRLPGAIHIDFTKLFHEDSTLKSVDEITKLLNDAGISKDDQVATYCTAGIRSAYMQLIMEMCGFENVKNYDESFYRWSASQEVEK